MARQIVHHFAAAGGVADVYSILQVQMCGQSCEVVGIMIHVVAVGRLGRAAMTAPVMGDHTKTLAEEEEHLGVPIVCRERPSVTKHDGLSLAPVLVVNLRSIFRGDRTHDTLLFVVLVT